MGVSIGSDDAKNGKNTYLLVVMRVRLSQKIGLLDLMNWTQSKKGNGYKIRTKSVRDYWEMRLMLHMQSIYYWHTNVDLLGVCPCPPGIQIFSARRPIRGEIFLLKRATFWPGDTIRAVSALFYQYLQDFYSIFHLKNSKKGKNMMSCTRLYVYSTETLMVQGRKKRLLSLPKELFENTCR